MKKVLLITVLSLIGQLGFAMNNSFDDMSQAIVPYHQNNDDNVQCKNNAPLFPLQRTCGTLLPHNFTPPSVTGTITMPQIFYTNWLIEKMLYELNNNKLTSVVKTFSEYINKYKIDRKSRQKLKLIYDNIILRIKLDEKQNSNKNSNNTLLLQKLSKSAIVLYKNNDNTNNHFFLWKTILSFFSWFNVYNVSKK